MLAEVIISVFFLAPYWTNRC